MSQSQMTRSSAWRNRTLSESQFNQTTRLSQAKTTKNPPPVDSYFPNFYNRCRSMRICEHSHAQKILNH
jgi:hypothetical protein